MIDKLGGDEYSQDFEVTCDDCGETEEYLDISQWSELMEQMKADGWKNRKIGNDWCHYCADCTPESPF